MSDLDMDNVPNRAHCFWHAGMQKGFSLVVRMNDSDADRNNFKKRYDELAKRLMSGEPDEKPADAPAPDKSSSGKEEDKDQSMSDACLEKRFAVIMLKDPPQSSCFVSRSVF